MNTELAEIMTRLATEQTKYSTKKTKVQATRVRASLLELKKACDSARRATLEEAKAIPSKPRSKKLVSIDVDDEEMPSAPLKLERKTTEVEKTKRVRKPSTKKMEE
jgi:hypothetical protein